MITISKLDFGYKKHPLFNTLNLKLNPGNIYGLLGKNGAGKTTLLKIVSGLIFPDAGTVDVMGFMPSRRYPDFLKEIFFLPEEFYLPAMKPGQFRDYYAPFYPAFDNSRYEELIEEFQLQEDQKLSSYSYGQKKKFLVSFGIACNSRLFLLDEPTNGLDIPSKTQFRRIIASAGSEERTIIISTHQARDMENLIDPLIIIDQGKVIFNEFTETAAEKLAVRKTQEKPENYLYLEQEVNGYKSVQKNTEGDYTGIDLETLFNVVVCNPSEIEEIFNGGNK